MSILFLAQVKITKNTSKKCEICIIHIEIFLNHDIIALQSIRFAFIKIKIFIRISNGHSHTSARYDSPAKRIFAFIKIKNFIRISNGHSRTSIQYISPAKHSLCIDVTEKFHSKILTDEYRLFSAKTSYIIKNRNKRQITIIKTDFYKKSS